MSNAVGGMIDALYGMEFQLPIATGREKAWCIVEEFLFFFPASGIIPTRSRRDPDRNPFSQEMELFCTIRLLCIASSYHRHFQERGGRYSRRR